MAGAPSRAPAPERVYAGIGSRTTPPAVLALIESTAAKLAHVGWVLRTGLSPGVDQAFYRGARAGGGEIELYLPWPGFEARARGERAGERVREHSRPSPAAFELAARFYRPFDGREWAQLCADAQALLARDPRQVLDAGLDRPAARVVCWTPDGGLDGEDPRAEGTGQALRIAQRYGVPVLNLARPEHELRVRQLALPL